MWPFILASVNHYWQHFCASTSCLVNASWTVLPHGRVLYYMSKEACFNMYACIFPIYCTNFLHAVCVLHNRKLLTGCTLQLLQTECVRPLFINSVSLCKSPWELGYQCTKRLHVFHFYMPTCTNRQQDLKFPSLVGLWHWFSWITLMHFSWIIITTITSFLQILQVLAWPRSH